MFQKKDWPTISLILTLVAFAGITSAIASETKALPIDIHVDELIQKTSHGSLKKSTLAKSVLHYGHQLTQTLNAQINDEKQEFEKRGYRQCCWVTSTIKNLDNY